MPHVDYIGPDGQKWPSATELTALLPQAWLWSWYKSAVKKHGRRGWQLCKAQSKRGATIGTEVHTLLEYFIHPDQPTSPISGKYESQQFADALFDRVNPLVDEWVAIEPHLVSETLKLHGTADAVIRMAGTTGLTMLDWKTSASKSETHPIQLCVYAMLWNESHPDQRIDRGVIARVDKKSKRLGVKLDEYAPLSQYIPVVKALREIYSYVNPMKQVKE
jgi:PD-(D/E)XK nuclease superfamily protein